ncbi:response regulator [Kocuria tytonis]|uniref:Transcriptional regulatory protein n=1 Tax=Kocuria tytonis TaxID=2054280 RepID=A0A495A6J1_9MICC|nr:response regulator [Kocuria tytonis]RKQ34942.1 response regulator [Kocuria tytonis]
MNDVKVLIIDDDFHVAALHVGYVNAVPGFTALPPVHDLRAVAAAVEEHAPDLMLVDVYFPQGSGLDVLRAVDVDAFVLSAASERATVAAAFRRGALAYLLKPFEPEVLMGRLRAYARYRRQLDAPGSLTQASIDRARRAMTGADDAAVTSAASATESAVAAAVAEGGEVTVMEVARAVGISRATAQRYLSQLVQRGTLRLELRYGTRGRPEHCYAVRG